jgi:hypothetical protein
VLALVFACGVLGVARAEVTDEEYAVYKALLQQVDWWSGDGGKATVQQYVLRETTRAAVLFYRNKQGVDVSILSSFDERNRAPDRIDAKRFAGMKVRLVSDREYKASFWSPAEGPMTFDGRTFRNAPPSRDSFEKKYRASQGLLTVSRVGFSDDGSRALLYYDNEIHDRGEDGLVLLEKTPQGWKPRHWLSSGFSQ